MIIRPNFDVLLADPPWAYRDEQNAGDRGAVHKYDVMDLPALKDLDVQRVLAEDAAAFVWTTGPMLPAAFELLDAWDLRFLTVAFWWVKTSRAGVRGVLGDLMRILVNVLGKEARKAGLLAQAVDALVDAGLIMPRLHTGMGWWTRSNAELCLLATKGKPQRVDRGVHSVILAPVGEHSAKPPEARNRIERLMGPDTRKLEMFARERTTGWSIWGNEAPDGSDVEILARQKPPQLALL